MRNLLGVMVVFALLVCAVGVVQAGTMVLREGGGTGITDATFDDTYVDSRTLNQGTEPQGDLNFGTTDRLWLSAGSDYPYAWLDTAVLIGVQDLFPRLQAAGVSSSSDITSASLTITPRGTKGTYILRMTNQWMGSTPGAGELLPTWNEKNAPGDVLWAGGGIDRDGNPSSLFSPGTSDGTGSKPLRAVDFEGGATSDGTGDELEISPQNTTVSGDHYTVDITDFLKTMWDADLNAGWVIRGGAGGTTSIWSSEAPEPTDRPTLTIEYVPEPATMSILAIGGIAALLRRRR